MSEECGVMVGVRIRPFNQREKDLGAVLCVDMQGPMTTLNPPPEGTVPDAQGKKIEVKKFTFDASFWSHDGFDTLPNGYCTAKPGSSYADQQHVFERFGKAVLDNAWAGYHCCLFAYGQTGAGKSYSMVGYGANRGIVPISCEEIFQRIGNNTDPELSYEVLVSMVEIYNEQVQDLLIHPNKRPKRGLEVRESKQLGIFIEGVSKRAVATYPAIEAVVDEGTNNRTVGSTLMNATSSRAHTVLIIEFKQVSQVGDQKGEKVSLINLVDLAGSEKAGQTGAQGDRLKEGCAINKSLSALGNVIEKLADKAEKGSKKQVVIPYRDSKLTRLLQNALGGSSKTIMICAISPASTNHEETLSTLRYADRAKRIKNQAQVNENPQDKLIRQLREENAKLRELIEKGQLPPGAMSAGAGNNMSEEERAEAAAAAAEAAEEMARKKAEIDALEGALTDMQKSFAERLEEAKAQAAKEADEKRAKQEERSTPHLANLNEDALLTNKLYFSFPSGVVKSIGRKPPKTMEPPNIVLAGAGIQVNHATISNMSGLVKLLASEDAILNTFVNGANPQKPERPTARRPDASVELFHGDRVAFGQCIFVFVDPDKGSMQELLDSGKVNYAEARKEITDGGGVKTDEELAELKASKERAEELEKLVREAEEAKNREKEEAEALLKQREEEFKKQMEQLQQEWERSKAEAEANAAAAAAQAAAVAQAAQAAQVAQAADAAAQEQEKAAAEEKAQAQAAQARAHAEQLEKERARMQRDFEERQRRAEEAAQQRIKDLEKKAQKAAAEEEDHRQRELNMRRLEEQLMVAMPLVKEANLIAVELNRPYHLDTKMQVELTGDRARGSIHVSAIVLKDGVRVYEWSLETLENRVYLLRDILQQFEDEGLEAIASLPDAEDPFWDPIEVERQIGVAQASLQGLLMQVENQHDCRILSTEVIGVATSRQDAEKVRAPHQVGNLRVEIWPCGRDGSPGIPDEEVVDEPEELLGTKMTVLVQVTRASSLPEELANDVRVDYDFFIDEIPYKVPCVQGHNRNPEFDYRKIFVQDPVTSRFMEYCDKKALVFRVYGKDLRAAELQAQQAEVLAQQEKQHPHPPLGPEPLAEAGPAAPATEPPTVQEEGPTSPMFPHTAGPEPPGPEPDADQAGATTEVVGPAPPPGPMPPTEPEPTAVPSISQVRREAEKVATDGPAPPEKKSKACAIL